MNLRSPIFLSDGLVKNRIENRFLLQVYGMISMPLDFGKSAGPLM